MTIQHQATKKLNLTPVPGLQPVRLPAEGFREFAKRMDQALAELVDQHGTSRLAADAEPAFASIKRHRRPR